MVTLAHLSHSEIPRGSIGIRNLDGRVHSPCRAVGPLGRNNLPWGDFLQLPLSELVPDVLKLGGNDSALDVGAGAGDSRLDAHAFHWVCLCASAYVSLLGH